MREIEAVNSEFEECYPMDNVRTELVLLGEVKEEGHPAAIFGWGNIKSLTEAGEDNLCADVKKFFDTYYSPDRMSLVIQAKLPEGDNLASLETMVRETFGPIPSKNLGRQNFNSSHPFKNCLNEVIAQEAKKDQNVISFTYFLPHDRQRLWNKSTSLIDDLI